MSDTILKNKYGEVTFISRPADEEEGIGFADEEEEAGYISATPSQIADKYIHSHMDELGLRKCRLGCDEAALTDLTRSSEPVINVTREKHMLGATVVVYEQTVMDLPVFNASMGVTIDDASHSVISLQSSVHSTIEIENPSAKTKVKEGEERSLTKAEVKKMSGISLTKMENVRVNRQVVYRYEADEREEVQEDDDGGFEHPDEVDLGLADVPDKISEGAHYIVEEILFEAPMVKGESPVNWRALVEPESGVILYIRALVARATGMVYVRDPQTQSGSSVTGASSDALLNPFRSSVTLNGLTSATPQPLSGEFVEIVDISAPAIDPPEGANPSSALNFNVSSEADDFSAVNAYYHCDNLFRTMQNYGFNVSSYFGGTTFPVPVDHRGKGGIVNADAPGNSTGDGMGMLRFGLLQTGQPVGIATSNRVVWHEFGHGLLWDNVSSPNFGFAHSAGDALAAIFNDPANNEPDRGHTFPWVNEGYPIDRRHDRTVAGGWAWFGPNWNTQYGGEQVLSSTLFRIYQSLGGSSTSLTKRRRASEITTFLIFKGIGLLSATSTQPEVFETALENADKTTANFKGIPLGTFHKVIRWGFEQQGLFQPGAAPSQGNNVTTVGNPPEVDVYINDGRNGEYPYLHNHWSCQDMWVRNSADGGLTHQQPLVGLTNYMYVRVKNRGMQNANNVSVDAYHCLPGTGLSFPDDWTPMSTATLPASGPIAPGGETIVGPFAFVPTQVGHECLLAIASADGDPGNDTTIMGTVPENRLVPFDNNIGQRNVNPIYPSLRWIIEWLHKHMILVRNPFKRPVKCKVKVKLPKFMRKLGWELNVVSRGGSIFELGPREKRKVILSIDPGRPFRKDIVKRAISRGDNEIIIETYLNGELSGGMTYPLSFDAKPLDPRPPRDDEREKRCILECVRKCKGKDKPVITKSIKPVIRRPVRLPRFPRPTIGEIIRNLDEIDLPDDESGVDDSVIDQPVRTFRMEFDFYEDDDDYDEEDFGE
ncbi:MAG: hypothetical protein DHS20C17_32150 [Cyclobacteriaceae bacterium]|nr:MAG: hypothetical protein DHS20C17_32150 [Cyclobacteriaceae bacterium]